MSSKLQDEAHFSALSGIFGHEQLVHPDAACPSGIYNLGQMVAVCAPISKLPMYNVQHVTDPLNAAYGYSIFRNATR